MLVVAGLSLKNLEPRVWNPSDPHYLPGLQAVMVSYADFYNQPRRRQAAMEIGLHAFLGLPDEKQVYLDNGAFFFHSRGDEMSPDAYAEFVARAKPDWWPIPQDYIPTPAMGDDAQRRCLTRTMTMNHAWARRGATPVIHISRLLQEYVVELGADGASARLRALALGGIVPNLLRAPKAMPYDTLLVGLAAVRQAFATATIHVFGLGGTATVHLAALFGLDSADSSGWRNRAARGLVQLPGSGDRMTANLGNWRGRALSDTERIVLRGCRCPACRVDGSEGLAAGGMAGFRHRATHNLHVLLAEADEVTTHLHDGSYSDWYAAHLQNSIYLPIIGRALALRFQAESPPTSWTMAAAGLAHKR